MALSKVNEGKYPLLCYEEAIGFLLRDICYDKDGISAAGTFLEMYNFIQKNYSRSCTEQLSEIYNTYGYVATVTSYFFCYDPKKMEKIFNRIRSLGPDGKFEYTCAQFPIRAIRDLTVGYDDNFPDKKPVLPVSASTQMLTFYFENGAQVTIRGSGTEPKLKYYADYSGGATREETDNTLKAVIKAIVTEYLQPDLNDLPGPAD